MCYIGGSQTGDLLVLTLGSRVEGRNRRHFTRYGPLQLQFQTHLVVFSFEFDFQREFVWRLDSHGIRAIA
ncbi:hypothetical protein HSB1_41680 [Halogranum salarium B-1]|uniref:Uncharacterized protein n=1 Tax=Halogranum salarium B-1 TaxID=1210908 RepID=J2ZA02_9EURY|nr:hypothetical protein HSB1_41680 [Halogranum salarium B-1]